MIKELGSGSYSKVYLIEEEGKKYVFKKFLPDFPQKKRKNEINVWRFLGLLSGETEDGFRTEYSGGTELFYLIPQRAEDALPIMLNIIDALEFLHSKSIVHLDLKPENIIVKEDGKITLIDFGFARTWDKEISLKHSIKLFNEKECMGSIYYIPPEILDKKCLDPEKADIYSLGVSFYCMVSGNFPFYGLEHDYIKNIMTKAPVALQNSEYPEAVLSIIMKMISKNPHQRPSLKHIRQIISDSFSSK